jgi:amidase
MMTAGVDLCFMTATEMAQRIRSREVSAVEVMEAHLAQIDRVNPKVNAIITLVPELAMEGARAADAAIARGDKLGPLHGLPIAHKDLVATAGIRTTRGSPIFADNIPVEDALIVERLRNGGAVTIGKTNVPEFGAGSHTFNPVFGATLNPYDTAMTCGGSSGGAAVALACGMIPIADGSDTGGSLRNPAAFCNVVGFRPSPGRVPNYPDTLGWFPISVKGPMARTVADVALMLQTIAGPDPRSPIAIREPGNVFAGDLERDWSGVKIAWSRDFGGIPIDHRITNALEEKRHVFSDIGCVVEEGEPDFRDADMIFKLWRAWAFELGYTDLIAQFPDKIKQTVVWNAQEGLKTTGPQLARAEAKRTELYHRVRRFMEEYEFMIFPVTQVPPFPISTEYPTEIEGAKMETYIDGMQSCYFITVTGLPAISVPCGFTPEGLPVGMQIVGRHQDDFGVLQLAHAFERATQTWRQRPPVTA